MLSLLRTLTGEGFVSPCYKWDKNGELKVFWVSDYDNDADGPNGNPDNDPAWQGQTSLKLRGESLDSYKVPGMVVPGWLPSSVGPIVLGCLGRITDLRTGFKVEVVVYDTGPSTKNGEGSTCAAKLLHIDPNPNNGGIDEPVILFECWPGIPALIRGIQYELQHI